MKKTFCILLALALCLIGAASAETVANPWVEATSADIAEAIGAAFGIPEGAEEITYALMPGQGLAEMNFKLDGIAYTARIQPAEAFTDIAGLYYEWGEGIPFSIAGFEGLERRAKADGEDIALCQWFDSDMGLMYAVSAIGADLENVDLAPVAGAIYAQAEEAE